MEMKLTGEKELRDLLKIHGPAAVHRALKMGVRDVAIAVVKEAQKNLIRLDKRTFGILFASMGMVMEGTGTEIMATVGPGLSSVSRATTLGDPRNYGYFVEFGRGPGGWPPKAAIELWAKRKLGDDDPQLVHAIRQKIAFHGVRPAPFLFPALEKARRGGAQRIFQAALDRSLKEAGK